MMKFVIDSAIPYIKGVLEPYGDVLYLNGASISSNDIMDADALIIRTRTKCNSSLLSGSSVKMIATATIGTDHIDFDYCKSKSIEIASAPGCNSSGVCQWVFAALEALSDKKGFSLEGKTLGVVGVGHVGKKVSEMAAVYGMTTLLNDPPRQAAEGDSGFVSLDRLLSESDIVTVHIPLSEENIGFVSDKFFDSMKSKSVFINASRGEVVNEDALLRNLDKFEAVALDVWNHEPNINLNLLKRVDIATMHIAGYSIQGKINGTNMALAAVCRHFGLPILKSTMGDGLQGDSVHEIDVEAYDIMSDDAALRAAPDRFEQLRNEYNFR